MQEPGVDIEVVRGSVTDQAVDAIVNAANKSMKGGGGIDGRIHRAAGPEMMAELRAAAPDGAATGQPVVTRAYKLPQKYVIHVAGPRWRGGTRGEAEQLFDAYYNSLKAASDLGLASIAFCSIATGVYGYPIEQAAPLAIGVATRFIVEQPETSLRRIVFALWGSDEYDVFEAAYRKWKRE